MSKKSQKIKILLVEDDEIIHELVMAMLEDSEKGLEYLGASTTEEARRIMDNHSDIQAIVFDGQLVREDTIGLIKEVASSGFRGYMIAFSGDDDIHRLQMDAGCNESFKCKPYVQKLVPFMEGLIFPRPNR